jgi:hypothetical protein
VAVLSEGVVGFACSSRFRPKPAYETSVETTVYLAGDAVGRGAGSRLYTELFHMLEGEDIHRAYAGIRASAGIARPRASRCQTQLRLRRTSVSDSRGLAISLSRAESLDATGMSPGTRSPSAAGRGIEFNASLLVGIDRAIRRLTNRYG